MTAEIKTLSGGGQKQLRKPLGEIFVGQGLLTETSVLRLVEHAKTKDLRLGTLLELIGLITPEELAAALAIQYRYRTIFSFAKHTFQESVLRCVPMEMAVEHTIFPLKLEGGKLGLAVVDPTTEKLFETIATSNNVKVIPFISTRTEINRAIASHYLGRTIVASGEKTILIVEDDLLTLNSVTDILTRQGYWVETANDGMDAFKKIFTHKPKLVITDKVMPKLSGYEFLSAVRKIPEFRFTPVILMTAAATPDEEKLALEKGFFDFVLKPVKEIGLLTRVRRAFQSAETLYGKTG